MWCDEVNMSGSVKHDKWILILVFKRIGFYTKGSLVQLCDVWCFWVFRELMPPCCTNSTRNTNLTQTTSPLNTVMRASSAFSTSLAWSTTKPKVPHRRNNLSVKVKQMPNMVLSWIPELNLTGYPVMADFVWLGLESELVN